MLQIVRRRIGVLALALGLVLASAPAGWADNVPGPGPSRDHQAVQLQLQHGMRMLLEGMDLLILSEMGLAPKVDTLSRAHGKAMADNGKAAIDGALERAAALREGKKITVAQARLSAEMGAAMRRMIELIETWRSDATSADLVVRKRQAALSINHALGMAVEGSIMVLQGRRAGNAADGEFLARHGTQMVIDARAHWAALNGRMAPLPSELKMPFKLPGTGVQLINLLTRSHAP